MAGFAAMVDPEPAAARRAFIAAQAAELEPLAFVVVGLPQPPFDAIQLRHEDNGSFIVEIASRDASAPFTEAQAKMLTKLGFTAGHDTWAARAVASVADAVDLVEQVLGDAL